MKWGGLCGTGYVCVCANTFALFVTCCIKSVHEPPIAGKEKLCLMQKSIFLSERERKGEEQICLRLCFAECH